MSLQNALVQVVPFLIVFFMYQAVGKADADPQNAVTEIDLSLSFDPTSGNPPAQWTTYTLTLTLNNDGPQTATDIRVEFPKPNGVVYAGGNEYTSSMGTFTPYGAQEWVIDALGAGQQATLEVNYFLLVPNQPTAYAQVSAANEADTDSTPGNGTPPTVNEDDEANTDDLPPVDLLPDLKLANINSDFFIPLGTVTELTFDLINSGNALAVGDYQIGIYLSEDPNLDNLDLLVGEVITGFTPVGTISDIPASASIPANTPVGPYYLLLKVDANDVIEESNENNNTGGNAVQIFNDVPPPPGEGCGFLKPAGSFMNSVTGSVGFDSASETTDGYTFTGSSFSFANNTLYVVNSEIDLNGDFVGLDDTAIEGPEFSPITIEDNAPNLSVTRLDTDDASVLWSTDILFSANDPVVDFLGVRWFELVDGYFISGTAIAFDSGSGSADFIPFVVKLSEDGEELNLSSGFEGPNGEFYPQDLFKVNGGYVLNGRGNGNLVFIGLSEEGDALWSQQHAADLPSNRLGDIKVSKDGNFIYAANRNNLRAFLEKVDVATGEEVYAINLNTLFSFELGTNYPFAIVYEGIIPTEDGGLITGFQTNGSLDIEKDYIFGKVDPEGNHIWTNRLEESRSFKALLETSDGGALFLENIVDGNQQNLTAMKVTSAGQLVPTCGDDDPPIDDIALPCELAYRIEGNSVIVEGEGLNAAHLIIKLFDPNWNTFFACVDDCDNPLVIDHLPQNGTYHFSVNTFDENWSQLCAGLVDLPFENSVQPRQQRLRNEEVLVYPNPVQDELVVDVSVFEGESVSIQLINSLGVVEQIGSQRSNEQVYTFTVETLEDGLYFLRIQREGKKVITKRVIVQKGR